MKMLLIKTSSMGDIIHTLPALTDAKKAIPDLTVDWVIEEAFVDIPSWHPAVTRIIPIAQRQWRKRPFAMNTISAFKHFYRELQKTRYDLILDAQGLFKSAFITWLARGKRTGFAASSAREPLASLFYQDRINVAKNLHAITRLRMLFSHALDYPMPETEADYHLTINTKDSDKSSRPYFVFLHGTTWQSKLWPEHYWCELARLITDAGFAIKISGGNAREVERAKRIAATSTLVEVMPYLSIAEMAKMLSYAKGVIAVDTGFAHLAAALEKPVVTLYGATRATLTGTIGKYAHNMSATQPECSPCLKRKCHYSGSSIITPACYEMLTPDRVWKMLKIN